MEWRTLWRKACFQRGQRWLERRANIALANHLGPIQSEGFVATRIVGLSHLSSNVGFAVLSILNQLDISFKNARGTM
ncbi:MAG: hypothetical protein Rhob2KO_05350 [Rhodopirellula baltica]